MCGLWGTDDEYRAWGWPDAEIAAARARVEERLPRWSPPREAWTPFERAAVDAALDAGVPWCPDPDVAGSEGIGPAPLTMVGGRRWSTNDAYLEPARRRPNLAILGDAEVERVLLDGRRAVGARLVDGTVLRAARVVVCGGAVASPALLLRSGVAHPELGAHLLEHPSAAFRLDLMPGARVVDPGATLINVALRYTSGLAGAGRGDMQVLFLGTSGPGDELGGVAVGQVAVMAACSEGTVTVAGDGRPKVDFALLSDERDRSRLRDGARHLWTLLGHPAVMAVARRQAIEVDLADDVALDQWLAANTGDYVHAAGTCRLGAVVAPDGAVSGYAGLHVIDASAMPVLPRANAHLSTVLLAELMVATLTD
jgi:5-(hydroxymethyl)furfural/furfural oxidase